MGELELRWFSVAGSLIYNSALLVAVKADKGTDCSVKGVELRFAFSPSSTGVHLQNQE